MKTWEEAVNMMLDRLPEEIDDSNSYFNWAKEFEYMDCPDLAEYFKCISYEEYTHSKILHDTLVKNGHVLPADIEVKWHQLEERIKLTHNT